MSKIMWFVAKAAGGGLISYAAPRFLVSAGVPLDEWIVAMGGSFHLTSETALWAATVVIGLLLFLADRLWRRHYRNIHHVDSYEQAKFGDVAEAEVAGAEPRAFSRSGARPQRSVYEEELARAKARRFAEAVYGAGGGPGTSSRAPYAPILFNGLAEAKDTPKNDWTALRVVVRNDSDENLTGLVARLIRAEPELGSMHGAINLPLVLATKGRLDRLRNPAIKEQIPHQGFNLHAHSEKAIEVVWLHSKGALEGYITHEAGETEFLFVGSQELYVEVTGAGHPIVAGVRINVADDDIQSWTPQLIIEAVGEAHGGVDLTS